MQEDLKTFKSDTFENYKSFVPAEVQNLSCKILFHWVVKSNHKQKCLDPNQWNCQSINWYFIRSDFKINAMGWRYTCTTLLLRGSSIIEPIWNDLWERQIRKNSDTQTHVRNIVPEDFLT